MGELAKEDGSKHAYPMGPLGHEGGGTVVEVGEGVKKLKEGDRYASDLDTLRRAPRVRNLDKVRGKNAWSEKPFYPLRVRSGTTLCC